MRKKLFGILLSAFMLITLLPATVFAEISTIEDVLATVEGGFPTSETNAWVNEDYNDKKIYLYEIPGNGLYFHFSSGGSLGIKDQSVTPSGSNYTYSSSYYSLTFNMESGKLSSITLVDKYFDDDGTYAKPVTVGDILPADFPKSAEASVWKNESGTVLFIDTGNNLAFKPIDSKATPFVGINAEVTPSGNDYTYVFSSNTLIFHMSDGNLTSIEVSAISPYSGTYEVPKQYTLTYSNSGSNTLTSSITSGSKVITGNEVSITATPASDYQLDAFTTSEEVTDPVVNGSVLSFKMPNSDLEVSGSFNHPIYSASIDFAVPKVGDTTSTITYPTADDSLPYTIFADAASVRKVADDNPAGTFEKDTKYYISIILTAKDGHSFKHDGGVAVSGSGVTNNKYGITTSVNVGNEAISSYANLEERNSKTKSGYYCNNEASYKAMVVNYFFTPKEPCDHSSMKHVPLEYPNVMKSGVLEHYYCEDCEKYFEDEKGEKEVSLLDLTIDSLAEGNEWYVITDGKEASIDVSKASDTLFKSDASFDKFIGVMVDNSVIASSYYTATSGSTDVTLKASYLKTLSNGTHTLVIISKDGHAKTTFTITGNTKPSPSPYIVPDTSVR